MCDVCIRDAYTFLKKKKTTKQTTTTESALIISVILCDDNCVISATGIQYWCCKDTSIYS